MSDPIMQALFIQQRLQILSLGVHHDEFTDAYLYAWNKTVYPWLSDTDGSVPQMPHEIYGQFFKTTKCQVKGLFDFLADRFDNKNVPTFYELEKHLNVSSANGERYDRADLIRICCYFYLEEAFDHSVWEALLTPHQHPSEARAITRDLVRTEIYLGA